MAAPVRGAHRADLAGLADLYIGRVGYKSHEPVRDYLFDEVDPDMINLHESSQNWRSCDVSKAFA